MKTMNRVFLAERDKGECGITGAVFIIAIIAIIVCAITEKWVPFFIILPFATLLLLFTAYELFLPRYAVSYYDGHILFRFLFHTAIVKIADLQYISVKERNARSGYMAGKNWFVLFSAERRINKDINTLFFSVKSGMETKVIRVANVLNATATKVEMECLIENNVKNEK